MEIIFIILGIVIGFVIGWLARPQNKLGDQLRAAMDAQQKMMMDKFKSISFDVVEKQRDAMVGTQKLVVGPVAEEMKKLQASFDDKIKEIVASRAQILAASTNLNASAENLANALKNKKQQGCWGELQLEVIFDMLGFVEGREYSREENTKTADGNIRPDYILNLPNDRRVIIDSKVSLASYINYVNAADESEKQKFLNEFIAATENHIKTLGSRDYQKRVKDSKLDYVFMFMPLESAYFAALSGRKDLYQLAFENNVAIITPSLLLPMMRTIDTLLKMDKQNKNIEKAVGELEGIYNQFATFTKTYAEISTKIETAEKAIKNVRDEYVHSTEQLGRGVKKLENAKHIGGIQPSKQMAVSDE
ncbi:MAG: DNA recombination protein RmuC [Rickettsiales bacterium]|jgi:DNA recombination protein RmuC|nr:DNA recombination protein RmuC [Rickettsiales bacterium]